MELSQTIDPRLTQLGEAWALVLGSSAACYGTFDKDKKERHGFNVTQEPVIIYSAVFPPPSVEL